MPFSTTKEHREYFRNHQRIEFENLLTEQQCRQISEGIRSNPSGRDIWRQSAAFKKIICNRDIAQIASELTGTREMRIAFDQVLDLLPRETATLSEISCVQGVVGGLIVCIEKPTDSSEVFSEFFPQNVGEGIFFSADCPILFEDIAEVRKGSYLLVAYAAKDAVYIHNAKDPYLHQWKEIGYTFGDRLQNVLHPQVYP